MTVLKKYSDFNFNGLFEVTHLGLVHCISRCAVVYVEKSYNLGKINIFLELFFENFLTFINNYPAKLSVQSNEKIFIFQI